MESDRNYYDVPPRILLDHLEPIGMGTGRVEKLTSYVLRLAANASVSSGAIISKLTMPILPAETNTSSYYLANGAGDVATNWVMALQRLTGRPDLSRLTLVNWKNAFPSSSLISSRTKRWCRHCYQDCFDQGTTIYEQLIWSFSAVQLCPIHLVPLEGNCTGCGQRDFLEISARQIVGFCPACYGWLGKRVSSKIPQKPDPTFSFHKWVSQSYARLLDHELTHQAHVNRASVHLMIETGIQRLFDGNAAAFGRHLLRRKSVISGWRSGKVLPNMGTIAEISFAFQIPLECLFIGDTSAWNFSSAQALPYSVEIAKRKKRPRRLRPWETYEIFLGRVASGEIGWIRSFAEVAKILEIDEGALRRRFPELAAQIASITSKRRRGHAAQRIQEVEGKLLKAALDAATAIQRSGLWPSRRRILKQLERDGIRATRRYHSVIRKAQLMLPQSTVVTAKSGVIDME